MFRTKPRRDYIFGKRKPKPRRNFTWLWLLISAILSLLVLELLTRIYIDLSGKREEFAQAISEPDIAESYQLKFLDQKGNPLEGISNTGNLIAQQRLSVGYQLVKNQENPYWQINEHGFRDRDELPITKPQDEIRIFILGGSTAFGYGSSSNETAIADQLENRLQKRLEQQKKLPQLYKPDVLPEDEELRAEARRKTPKLKQANYRVINAAVPGYASGNQLAQLALQVLPYKPDFIIVLDGYEDLILPSEETAAQVPQFDEKFDSKTDYVKASTSKLLKPLEDKSYLAKVLQDTVLQVELPESKTDLLLNINGQELASYIPESPEELQRRVDRYFQNHKQMVTLATGSNASVIFATQPEITGRKPSKLTPTEGEITTQLGRTYIRKTKDTYPRFVGVNNYLVKIFPKNVKALNLYNLSDKYPSPSFIDAIHLTEPANEMVAEQLYYAISSFSKMQVKPREPQQEQES
ncbi:GDSL-like Lipase/Acylhydrolase [Xenococcus sp. PCC 7305]|uniref:SGNH/GDSL hydrolase family protein n=1 Tax=Xenococcus sp. PCC 7305 TaxID=102125 RepID=UPI0002ACD3C8|nr:SGNH/GDSL hydrolase family protein [Xenococcus sp. PCC 7305]ELS04599.1 GDSL-like Lipase/Acylhydrolase [Xenococcus sp. PCC 7305]